MALRFHGILSVLLLVDAVFDPDVDCINVAVRAWLDDPNAAEARYGHISKWNTTGVTNMSYLFSGAKDFNETIGGWDTGSVTDMRRMFEGASAFNQDIRDWDTGRVVDMRRMFEGASAFNQDIRGWDTGRVVDMSRMFHGAAAFNQDLTAWDTRGVTEMECMFCGASAFEPNFAALDARELATPGLPFLENTAPWTLARRLRSQGCQNDISFVKAVVSTEADAALSVFAIDVDNDGDVDVLSASYNDNTIAWYENDGGSSPSFERHVISTEGDGAMSVFAIDVDNDGDVDVLSASIYDDTIAWYENDGGSSASFERHVISTEGDGALSVFAIDVDNDGDVDVLSASIYDDTIAWYENDGGSSASFERHVIASGPSEANGAMSVFAIDVDNDGDVDVLSASIYDDTIAWYENDGGSSPSFERHVISTEADGADSVYAADLDGDGDVDVVTAADRNSSLVWHENDGGSPPSFERHVISTSDDATGVFAMDLDGDGDVDVLSASWIDDTIAWYENDGGSSPSFERHVISTEADGARSVFAIDVDNDGDVDVLSASTGDNTIAWYENDCILPDPTPEPTPEPTPQPIKQPTPEPTLTHLPTVIPTQQRVCENDVEFKRIVMDDNGEGPVAVFAVDMDDDGDLDVVSVSSDDNTIAWFESDGGSSPSFERRIISTELMNPRSVFAVDVDQDGDADVLSASYDNDTVSWFENDGKSPLSFSQHIISTEANGTMSVYAVDLDDDGDVDVLSASFDDDTIAWYENDGESPPSFQRHVISTDADGANAVYAADVDDDGDVDVLSASANDDTIAWYYNDGGIPPEFGKRVISTEADGANSVYASDVDDDGDVDVLSTSANDDTIAWYENDGGSSPSFERHVLSTDADNPLSVYAADVDHDGDIDVVSASENDDMIAWYENDGKSPPSFERHVISEFIHGASAVYAADLDRDGDIDILSASFADSRITWFESDCVLGIPDDPRPTVSPSPEPTPKPSKQPSPEVTEEATSKPSKQPSPELSEEATPKPSTVGEKSKSGGNSDSTSSITVVAVVVVVVVVVIAVAAVVYTRRHKGKAKYSRPYLQTKHEGSDVETSSRRGNGMPVIETSTVGQ